MFQNILFNDPVFVKILTQWQIMNFEGQSPTITLNMLFPSSHPPHLVLTKNYLLVEFFNELHLIYFYISWPFGRGFGET